MLVLLVGLGIALLLNWSFRGRTLVRGILAMPWAMPDVPTVLTFLLMMDPNFGVFNRIISWFGIDKHVAWLTDPHVAFLSVVAITVWKGFPFYALITLSALQAVPDDLIEAAKVDGASTLRRFWHVILPAITPTLLLLAVLAFIYSLQTFSLIYLTTGGGPGNKTTTSVAADLQRGLPVLQLQLRERDRGRRAVPVLDRHRPVHHHRAPVGQVEMTITAASSRWPIERDPSW